MSWIDDLSPGFTGWRTWPATPNTALEVFGCRGLSAGPLALITAGVHGDEYEGPAAIFSLAQLLSPDRVRGTIIAVPVANPAAFAAGTRVHPGDGCNLAEGRSIGPISGSDLWRAGGACRLRDRSSQRRGRVCLSSGRWFLRRTIKRQPVISSSADVWLARAMAAA